MRKLRFMFNLTMQWWKAMTHSADWSEIDCWSMERMIKRHLICLFWCQAAWRKYETENLVFCEDQSFIWKVSVLSFCTLMLIWKAFTHSQLLWPVTVSVRVHFFLFILASSTRAVHPITCLYALLLRTLALFHPSLWFPSRLPVRQLQLLSRTDWLAQSGSLLLPRVQRFKPMRQNDCMLYL